MFLASAPGHLRVLGGLFSRTFMTLQTQVDSIISYGTTYLSIVSVVCVGYDVPDLL